jgi:hypothetical protein
MPNLDPRRDSERGHRRRTATPEYRRFGRLDANFPEHLKAAGVSLCGPERYPGGQRDAIRSEADLLPSGLPVVPDQFTGKIRRGLWDYLVGTQ